MIRDDSITLKDGSVVSQEWVMEQVSRLKQMKLTNTKIASTLKLTSISQVSYYWKKVQELSFAERARVPGSVVKGEVLEILKTLRTEAFSMITHINKKNSPALFITVLKTVKEMIVEEVKFMISMKMLKPEEDRIKLTLDEAESFSLNELYTKLEEAKKSILEMESEFTEELEEDPEDVDLLQIEMDANPFGISTSEFERELDKSKLKQADDNDFNMESFKE